MTLCNTADFTRFGSGTVTVCWYYSIARRFRQQKNRANRLVRSVSSVHLRFVRSNRQAQVLDLIGDLRKKYNTAMLLITHDMGVVATVCDDVAVIYAGSIVEYGSKSLFNIF